MEKGEKNRERCPKGTRWNESKGKCVPMRKKKPKKTEDIDESEDED